jgi:AcrR family transcriptional regulator
MVRKYDSSNRRKAAARTRQDILQAALRLHWEGVTGFEPLAREAGCSVATVRKHFPTKEMLFQNCTRTFIETLTPPDLPTLGEIADPVERIEAGVNELCRIHEAMFGYAWLGAHQRKDSPTLEAEMAAYDGLADAVSGLIAPHGTAEAAPVRGLLDFLTYRAMRLSGRLSPGQAREELTNIVKTLISGAGRPPAP